MHDEAAALHEDMLARQAEFRESMQAMRADFQSDIRRLLLQLFGFTVGVAMVAVAVAKLI